MKFVTGVLLVLSFSFAALADSRLEDSASLGNCGGSVELRSYSDSQGAEKFSLQFRDVSSCSNVRLSNGKSYKLTDKDGNFLDKNITLSDDAVAAARNGGLGILIESNKGSTSAEVSVQIRPVYTQPSNTTVIIQSEPSSW